MRLPIPTPPTIILLLLPITIAHVKLVLPVPYGASTLNTNPLLTTGADYPCKQRPGVYAITQWNNMPINSPQTIAFQGQATHGGGSCQISLTRDTPPTANSVFKVIQSIEGGCPSTNPGNVGTDPFGYGADNFTFSIPDVIAPANYTLAWTWFNKIGEREMYMNCAPVTVTPAAGGKARRRFRQRADAMDSLPVMFRANSGNGCSTAESGKLLAIPEENRGRNVQRIGDEVSVPPVGSCGAGAGLAVGALEVAVPSVPVSTPASSVVASSAAPPAIQAPPTSPAAPSVSSAPPVAQVSTAPVPPAPSAPPAYQAPPAPPVAPSISPAAAPSTPSGMKTGTCPTPGKSICSPDGKAWGTCMENHQVIYQPVAAGTKCDPALGVEMPARMR